MKQKRKYFFVYLLILYLLFTMNFSSYAKEEYLFENDSLYTYRDMESDLIKLRRENKYILLDSLGKTLDNRYLYHICLGNIDAKSHILIIGSIHAREYITSKLVMRQLYDIIKRKNDKSLDDALDKVAIHFIPMLNPDGVTLSQLGLDKINLQENRERINEICRLDKPIDKEEYLKKWKSNIRGIDLNRNFNAKWEEYNDKLNHASSDHYKGEKYESEIETKAIVNLTKKYPFKRTISYHTQGKVIYWYFGQKDKLYKESYSFAKMLANETGYLLDSNHLKLDPAGYKDWALEKLSIPSVTIEVGSGSSPVSEKQIDSIWEENKDICIKTIYSLISDN